MSPPIPPRKGIEGDFFAGGVGGELQFASPFYLFFAMQKETKTCREKIFLCYSVIYLYIASDWNPLPETNIAPENWCFQ